MNLSNQRRLAADILDVGQNRIWIDPEKADETETAITRDEIRKLIKDGVIKALPLKATSRGRARELAEKKRTGKRIGQGTKKGKKFSVVPKKIRWMNRIRALRKKLGEMRKKRIITVNTYRNLYKKQKAASSEALQS